MTGADRLRKLQQQRAAARSKPGSAGERIEGIAFDLATASRVVPPDEVYAAIAAHRQEVLTEAADVLDEIANKLDLFDDDKARVQVEETRSCARAIRVYAAAIAAAAAPTT